MGRRSGPVPTVKPRSRLKNSAGANEMTSIPAKTSFTSSRGALHVVVNRNSLAVSTRGRWKRNVFTCELRGHTCLGLGTLAICAKTPRLGLICSHICPGEIILKTYDFARCVRTAHIVIVSGFHSPIEKDCLSILLRGSEAIVIVQAHRLSTSRLPAAWRKQIDAERLLLISPFGEKQRRVTTELAVERNRFVSAISDEVLIPYAAPGSKTDILFQDLIASGKRIYTFDGPANAAMISSGAVPVTPNLLASRFGNGLASNELDFGGNRCP